MRVLIDPYVIMIPPLYSSAHRVLSYVQGIETWVNATSYPFLKIFHPSACIGCLTNSDRFPSWENVARLLSIEGVVQYTVQDIVRLATRVFDLCEDIEGLLKSTAIVGELTVMPKQFIDRLPQDVSELFCDYLARMVLQRDGGDPVLAEIYVGSVTGCETVGGRITIRGTVTEALVDTGGPVLGPVPWVLYSELTVLTNREDILGYVEWGAVWGLPSLAVEKGYYSTVPAGDRCRYALEDYNVGAKFIDTIVSLGLHSQAGRIRSIYETCALVACGRASVITGINPRRLNKSTSRADGAVPMRADISQKGPGFRLMYWRCCDGSIELSRVNVHNDVSID